MASGRRLCVKCRKELVYCDTQAPKGDWCEPCYWRWLDGGMEGKEVTVIEHKARGRTPFKSKWVSRMAQMKEKAA